MSNIDQLCSVLKSLDLSKREIKIYKVLLDRGLAVPSVISVISGIPRSMCYKYLNNLCYIGLITETTLNKQKAYFAEPPKKVLDLIDKKNKNLALQRKIASDAISKMDVNRLKNVSSPKIQYFNGIEGIKKL
jgi:sugar-specific transcriptional regulator TrmB